jgi:hypothetical protein
VQREKPVLLGMHRTISFYFFFIPRMLVPCEALPERNVGICLSGEAHRSRSQPPRSTPTALHRTAAPATRRRLPGPRVHCRQYWPRHGTPSRSGHSRSSWSPTTRGVRRAPSSGRQTRQTRGCPVGAVSREHTGTFLAAETAGDARVHSSCGANPTSGPTCRPANPRPPASV